MDHIVNVRVPLEELIERSFVGDIELEEFRLLARNQLDAPEDLWR